MNFLKKVYIVIKTKLIYTNGEGILREKVYIGLNSYSMYTFSLTVFSRSRKSGVYEGIFAPNIHHMEIYGSKKVYMGRFLGPMYTR